MDGAACITVVIRGSKNDQEKMGVRRTLAATACDMCPVQSIADWLGLKSWHPHSDEDVFIKSVSDRINRILKEIDADNGIDASRISTRSMRGGCATTLYAAGVGPIDIQRWVAGEDRFTCATSGMAILDCAI